MVTGCKGHKDVRSTNTLPNCVGENKPRKVKFNNVVIDFVALETTIDFDADECEAKRRGASDPVIEHKAD